MVCCCSKCLVVLHAPMAFKGDKRVLKRVVPGGKQGQKRECKSFNRRECESGLTA